MNFVVIDLETTGLDHNTCEIIEIGAVKIKNNVIIDELSMLIKPQAEIPPDVQELTGITPEMVAEAPSIEVGVEALRDFLEDYCPVAHNISFESGFLTPYFGEMAWLDTIDLGHIFWPGHSSYSLKELIKVVGITNSNPHRALADAMASAEIVLAALDKLRGLDLWVQQNLYLLADQLGEDALGRFLLQETGKNLKITGMIPPTGSKLKTPPGDDRPLLVNWDEEIPEDEEEIFSITPVSLKKLDSFLGEDGIGREKYPNFEYRPQQLEMARKVLHSFNSGEPLVIEAGTGTGKSLAYLLPSVLFARENHTKVVVSTHTINLQEQLLQKDIPLLSELLGEEIKASVVKGRGNYLCLTRWSHAITYNGPQIIPFLMSVAVWMGESGSGDVSHLSLRRDQKWQGQAISAGKESCLGPLCPYFKTKCFVHKARQKAFLSDIVVINHSLLLANAGMERGFLPEFSYLVVDEAHHLDKVAKEQLTQQISYYQIAGILERLSKKERGSILAKWKNQLEKLEIERDQYLEIMTDIDKLLKEIGMCWRRLDDFFSALLYGFAEYIQGNFFPAQIRLVPAMRQKPDYENILAVKNNLASILQKIAKKLDTIINQIDRLEKDQGVSIDNTMEAVILQETLSDSVSVLHTAMASWQNDNSDFVSWVEFSGKLSKDNLFVDSDDIDLRDVYFLPSLYLAPIDVGDLISTSIIEQKNSVIMTSATLAINGDFSFFLKECGLDNLPDIGLHVLSSPFCYDEQMLFAVTTDIPEPSQVPEAVYFCKVAESIIELVKVTNGRTMILFTSHYHLKSIYRIINPVLKELDIKVLAHGISGSHHSITEEFKSEKKACLLGAASFWEGVDIVGEALSMVIMVKIPFWPPSTPIISAKLDKLKAEGIDGFSKYSLPQAVIRFKQGYGRLIRSTEDVGAVVLLDKRFVNKRYGAVFRNALPVNKILAAPVNEIGRKVEEWLQK